MDDMQEYALLLCFTTVSGLSSSIRATALEVALMLTVFDSFAAKPETLA